MSYGLEICSSFAAGTEDEEYLELSVPSAVADLTSSVEFYFNNIGPFIIITVITAHPRAHVLQNNFYYGHIMNQCCCNAFHFLYINPEKHSKTNNNERTMTVTIIAL
jgi:hypothetical protein